jgi:carboxyl-terminal processing protease
MLLLAAVLVPFILCLQADELARTRAGARTSATNQLAPGPDDGLIAYFTAKTLVEGHYRQRWLDDEYSEKFFDRYIEALDPQRLHFTQADLSEFASYRTNLDNLTYTRNRPADTRPAYRIFNRFRERLEQRVAYVLDLLKNDQFVFDTDEQITVNRKDEPHPADLAEARLLWRQRLRSEYLGEKVAKYAAAKKAERAPKPKLSATGATNQSDTITWAEDQKQTGLTVDLNLAPKKSSGVAQAAARSRTNTFTRSTGESFAATPTILGTEKSKEVAAKPKKTDAEEIVETLTRRYTRNAHFYQDMDQQDVLEVYLTSLAHVYDPHTDYFNPRQAENFAIGMNLSLFGIGAVLQADMEGYCKIADLKPGPAMNSKQIKVGDRIVAVAQSNGPPVDVVDMNLNKVVQLVRGPKGSEVRLTVVSADSTTDRREVTLIREEIKLDDQAAKAKVIDYPTGPGETMRIGVIDLPTFYVPMDTGAGRRPSDDGAAHYTSKDVALLLAKLKAENVQGVILDLRRNGGGSLEECVKLTGLFIKDGPVVQVAGPGGQTFIDEDKDPRIQYDGPLIVLTSRFSASASEILAGALQDYNRALIVGDFSTHGKGTVQQLNPLRMFISEDMMTNNPGTLKITKAKFYRASGASTQLKGVMSDIVLPSKWNHAKDIGEEAYDTALPWDTIQSARFEKFDLVQPFLPDLMRQSGQRLGTNQDFAYIREDIEQFRKYQALNLISLNEQNRVKEWEEEDAKQRARDKERLSRKAPEPTVYELTLKQVDLPGLPPPVTKTNNLTAKLEGDATPANEDEEIAEATPPAVDPALEETERILVDYVTLLGRKGLASKAP